MLGLILAGQYFLSSLKIGTYSLKKDLHLKYKPSKLLLVTSLRKEHI